MSGMSHLHIAAVIYTKNYQKSSNSTLPRPFQRTFHQQILIIAQAIQQ